MKFAPLAAALLLATAATVPAFAQNQTQAEAALFTLDTPIEVLMSDARAKAVVIKHFGGQDVSQHPAYDQFKALSLKAVAPFSQGLITEEMLAAIAADLALIK
jgi:hypothetical protein